MSVVYKLALYKYMLYNDRILSSEKAYMSPKSNLLKHHTAEQLFEEIYFSAKNNNKEKLVWATTLTSIHLKNKNRVNAITQLALENDIQAVSLLLQFDASIYDAMRGFAQGGHREIVDILLIQFEREKSRREAHDDTWSNTRFITSLLEMRTELLNDLPFDEMETKAGQALSTEDRNLIVANFIVQLMENGRNSFVRVSQEIYHFICENLRNGVFYDSFTQVEHAINKTDHALNQTKYGTAIAGIFFKIKTSSSHHLNALLQEIACGFALGGHETEVYEFRNRINKSQRPGDRDFFSHELVECFAENGHKRQAYQLFRIIKQNNQEDVLTVLGSMAHGFALLGDQATIDEYLAMVDREYRFLNPSYVVLKNLASGFAENGDITAVDNILEQMTRECPAGLRWELPSIGRAFAAIGLKISAYEIFSRFKQRYPSEIQCGEEMIGAGFIAGGHRAEAYEFLQMIIQENPGRSVYNLLHNMARNADNKEMYNLLDEVETKHPEHIGDMLCSIHWHERDRASEKDKKNHEELNKNVVLKALSMAGTSDLCSIIVNKLNKDNLCNTYNPQYLIPKAIKFNTTMKTQKINYNQLVFGWIQPDVSICLLQAVASKLPVMCILVIITYMTPLSLNEAGDLGNIFAKYIGRVPRVSYSENHRTSLIDSSQTESIKANDVAVNMVDSGLKLFSGTAHFWSSNNQSADIRSNVVPYSSLITARQTI